MNYFEKLGGATKNLVDENISKLAELFPECVTETTVDGKIRRAINFERLKEILGDNIGDGREFYEFNFVGKKQAHREACADVWKTLRPCRDESRNFDTTKNLYIEGDNLEALKILRESYLGKVKLIYVDPPYNTGNDFIYRDDFKQTKNEFDAASGNIDDAGNRLVKNPDSNGQFHSDWCKMIYSRLLLAKNFLADDGAIFISIDDNEQANLKKICDEIFGAKKFVANIAVINNFKGRSDDKFIATAHENLLIYRKENFVTNGVPIPDEYLKEYKLEDERGKYRLQGLRKRGANSRREDRPNMFYPFFYDEARNVLSLDKIPNATEILPYLSDGIDGRWRWGKDTACERLDELIVQKVKGRDEYDVFQKDYLPADNMRRIKPKSFWNGADFSAEAGTLTLKSILGKGIFSTPKSVALIKYILQQGTDEDSIVMDFFSGSATTAHAVMELNAQDGGNRQFIMIQLPEPTPENSEARRANYETICDIGKERIRRAADKLNNPALDVGFRVFKVASSNIKPPPENFSQGILDGFVDNIEPDRDAWDLLFGCLLQCGLSIQLPVTSEQVDGFTVLNYNDGEILACFDKKISFELIKTLATRKPKKIFLRDAAFNRSADKINATEYLKTFAHDTEVNVI